MSEKRTVYLTPETLSLVRPGESLSGRINDVFARYAALREHLQHVQMFATSDYRHIDAIKEALTED